MKSIIIIILTLTTIEVAAQNHLIGITGGANWTNVTSSFSNQTDYRQGVSGGITYEYFVKKDFSIGADVIYNQRGFTDNFENPTGEKITINRNYDYLSVPVKTGFYDVGNKLFGFAKIGLIPSLLIDAKTTVPTIGIEGRITGTETTDVTNIVSKFDLAGLAEIGGGYKMVDRLWLTASFIYHHSLTSMTSTEYFGNNNKIRHNGMNLNIGLKWALKNIIQKEK
ncbi:MAG: porin family protein [Anditalea sp.]